MNEIVRILMNRDNMTKAEAEDYVKECRERIIYNGEDPEEVLYDLGLEPDYIFDLI